MREKRKNKTIIISLLGLLCIMTAGYAAFQTNLKIKGTSNINSNWEVVITSVTESNKAGGAETVGAPTWTNLTAYMEANLYEKGDYVEYDVTVENKGTLDAKLENITDNIKSSNEAVKISFSGYTKGQKLEKGKNQVIKVKVEYNPEFTGTIEEGSGEVSIELNYTQNDNYSQGEGGEIISPDRYLVTYDCITNGGSNCTTYNEYFAENSNINLNQTANKEGYELVGWNTNKDAKEALTSINMPSQNTTLYAIFRKGLKVNYAKGDGITSIGKENETCYLYNNAINCEITLPSITATGYTIQGWYNGETKVGNAGDKININQNITLTAQAVDDIKPTAPTYIAYYADEGESSKYTSGTWTDKLVLTKISTKEEGSGIASMQYSLDNGQTWTTFSFGYTSGIQKEGNTYYGVEGWSLFNRNQTVIFRAIDTAGNVSDSSQSFNIRYDISNPTLSVATSKTTKSITVVATASATSGITKYEFSNDGGSTWVSNGTNKTYTFNNLVNTKSYQIRVRVTSGIEKTTTSASTSVQPNSIAVPTYKETGTTTKTVTITYPSGCGSAYTCTYKKDSAAAVNVTSTTANVSFTASGTLSGTVSDGKNTVSSSYTVTVKPAEVYSWSESTLKIGDSITGKSTTKDPSTLKRDFYLKHRIDASNKITASYVCFVTDKEVCLQGGSSSYFTSNQTLLQDQQTWFKNIGGFCNYFNSALYRCSKYSRYNFTANTNGQVEAYTTDSSGVVNLQCKVTSTGDAYCYEYDPPEEEYW